MRICGRSCPLSKPSSRPTNTVQSLCWVRLKATMQSYFGYSDFRPGQLEALLPVVHGRDAFVRMPTGGGKTLCMFLPPLAMSPTAMGLIISPLIALIDQQVSILFMYYERPCRFLGIYACAILDSYQVQQLRQVGVSAIHAVRTDQCQDVSVGKYRFGGSMP